MTEELSSVIYIGHLPQFFEEKQMQRFFSQFGHIKNLRLARSKKTGTSKNFGWIEFDTPQIATIVAKSIHKYLLSDKVLVCHVVTVTNLHPAVFQNLPHIRKNPRQLRVIGRRELALRLASQEKLIAAKFAAKGIEYEWPSFVQQFEALGVAIPDPPPQTEAPADDE
jgi:nucleolar protein 15